MDKFPVGKLRRYTKHTNKTKKGVDSEGKVPTPKEGAAEAADSKTGPVVIIKERKWKG